MTVLKQYNTSTSTWDTVVVGQPGEPGIVTASIAPADTSVLWMDTADTASQVAVPSGGTAGQILAKTSGTDYATGWVDNTDNRNYIINGGMDIWQRGTSFNTYNIYSADRWQVLTNASSTNTSRQVIALDTVLTLDGLSYYMDFASTIASPAFGYALIRHRVEHVRTLAGKTAVISFYAKGSTASTIGFRFSQNFGTGGSAAVDFGHTSVSLTTSWARYSFTINVPSIAGKTIGADNTLDILFDKHLGTDFVSLGYSSLPNLAGTLSITGLQLESGSAATPFKRAGGTLNGELAACQRYYWRWTATDTYSMTPFMGFSSASNAIQFLARFPVTMRSRAHSIDVGGSFRWTENRQSYTEMNNSTYTLMANTEFGTKDDTWVQASPTSGTPLTSSRSGFLTANFSATAYLGFSAEL